MVELGFEALHFLETLDEGGAGVVALEIGHGVRAAVEALRFHEVVRASATAASSFSMTTGALSTSQISRALLRLFAGEKGDGGIDGVLLLAEVEDVAVGLGGVEHAVGAGEGLNQAVVLEVLVDIERVEVFGIEAGEQHVHHDGDVDLFLALVGQVGDWGTAGL